MTGKKNIFKGRWYRQKNSNAGIRIHYRLAWVHSINITADAA